MSAHTESRFHAGDQTPYGEAGQSDGRLPGLASASIIIFTSLGLWYGILKAVGYLAAILI
jgi:hypothetical protein